MYRFLIIFLGFLLIMPSVHSQENIGVRVSLLSEIATHPLKSAPASVLSLNDAVISAEISSRVVDIPVRVGDIVNKGDKLVGLDCVNYDLAVNQISSSIESLKIRADLAQKQLTRTESLRQNDTVSEDALDQRIVDLAVLESETKSTLAALNMAKVDQNQCMVISPFRAVLTARISAVGQFAGLGMPLVSILDIENVEVSAQISTTEMSQLLVTNELYFSNTEEKFPVVIRTVLPVINHETRNQEVRLLFSEKRAITGASGKLFWVDARPHISAKFLVERDGKLGIFLDEDGIATFHIIPNAQPGRGSPVNLPDNTRIIIDGHYSLRDKSNIKVIE
ncbi:MAG: RND family efflux transporter MFP subunit [Gammaproteobacteria bacterium]|jgi:RND family efflux transporter MFP subunit